MDDNRTLIVALTVGILVLMAIIASNMKEIEKLDERLTAVEMQHIQEEK